MKRDLRNTILWFVVITVLGILIQVLIEGNVLSPYYRINLYTIGINIILAVSLNLIIGITGQFSLGHAGFMAIGAYSVAITLQYIKGYPGFFLGIAIGVLLTIGLSLLIAIPTLRLRGDYLAIATLGFSEIIRIAILNMTITGGAGGLYNIQRLLTWPLLFGFIVFALIVVVMFKNSRYGRACISIREDEIAAESMGIPITRYKVISFTIGVCLAAMAGGLYAVGFNAISPSYFSFTKSIDVLVIVVFGGLGSFTGSIVSAIVLGIINIILALLNISDIMMILYSIILILLMIFRPSGLLGQYEFSFKAFKRKKKQKAVIPHEQS